MVLVRGNQYKFKYQSHVLTYLGKEGHWHQFSKEGDPRPVWSELLDTDLELIEEI